MTRFPIMGIGWNCKAERSIICPLTPFTIRHDRYSGTLVEFQFDFWTMELCFDAVSCDEVYDTVVKAFKGVYYNRRIRVIE